MPYIDMEQHVPSNSVPMYVQSEEVEGYIYTWCQDFL